MKTKQDIEILPNDDPKKLKEGWIIQESFDPYYLPSDDNSCYETDKADEFWDDHGVSIDKLDDKIYSVIPQLEFLWGQPWNNLALNYVMALKPSAIRVSYGMVTCDVWHWRVTVFVDKDNKIIKYIEQECKLGSIGVECGLDLQLKLQQQKAGKKIPKHDVTIIFNKEATIEPTTLTEALKVK